MIGPLLILCIWGYTLSADVTVVGRRGNFTVLQCGEDPGGEIVGVIWKIHHMNNSRCLFSYGAHMRGGPQIYNNCSTRMTFTNRTLTIHNTQISDGGNFTCELSSTGGTFFYTTILQVLAQPSVSLDINSDGSPECRAIGGFPAAEISWIPSSDDINTTEMEALDDTWTVISTYKSDRDMVVTCLVSHPTFVNVWSQSIVSPVETKWELIWSLVGFAIFLFIALCIVYWNQKKIRTCSKKSLNTSPPQQVDGIAEETQEFEPYATYTQRENVVYWGTLKVTRLN
ncbi:cell surface glycoprotein CD200 receptor 1-A-like [Rana temporaria]|uniref:cell surface glycoprotein CD200 receptor 1-A-like n=1 Tax=Rana temporaria TaxID=8407 RepID=UPI001AADC991|nr:cell surface glycoprotein CD200 receptor 1-A-like [Rana temporaria]